MTAKQDEFIRKLLTDRVVEPEVLQRVTVQLNAGSMDTRTASQTIDFLLKLPKVFSGPPPQEQNLPDVHEGRYALERDGTVKFYIVDRPTEGKWAGRTFLSIQAGPEKFPVRNPIERISVLAQIDAAPQTAMLRYGQELGHCGHCGRELTDAESIMKGIGPVCEGRMHW